MDDDKFDEIKEVRNILAHRNLPGRKMFMTTGKKENPPDRWKLKDLIINDRLTAERREWLSQSLSHAFEMTISFLENDI